MNRMQYFIRGVKGLKTKGTIAPTSKFTCRQIVKHINFKEARYIVELGAGDGRITRYLLDSMHPDAVLLSFEIDPKFCAELQKIEDPRLVIINDSAEYLESYLAKRGIEMADYVVSGLPFVVLPNKLGDTILQQSKEVLRPGGSFIQFHYSIGPKKRYRKLFDSVDVKLEVRNLPPAFVFICQ